MVEAAGNPPLHLYLLRCLMSIQSFAAVIHKPPLYFSLAHSYRTTHVTGLGHFLSRSLLFCPTVSLQQYITMQRMWLLFS